MLLALSLLGVGFLVGLSGALLPGPLLAFTVADSMKKGRKSGVLVILGHGTLEVMIIALLMLGVGNLLVEFKSGIFVAGGVFLIFMGYQMLRAKGEIPLVREEKSSVLGGFLFSLFNPGTPVWWATAGYALLLKGMDVLGYYGLALVVVGHWIADLSYYSFVAYSVEKGRDFLLTKSKAVTLSLSVFLFGTGVYFVMSAF